MKQKTTKEPGSKKYIAKRIALALLFIISICGIIFGAYMYCYRGPLDTSISEFVFDDENYFDSSSKELLNERCKEVQSSYGLNVFVITTDNGFQYSSGGMASKLNGYGVKPQENYAVLIIYKYSDFHFDIYTYGTCANKIKDKEIEAIIWGSGGDLLVDGQIFAGATSVVNQLGVAYAYVLASTESWVLLFVICGIIGLVVALIVYFAVKHQYSKYREVPNFSFANNSHLNLEVRKDKFLSKDVVFREIVSHTSDSDGSSFSGNDDGYRGGR